MLNKYLKNIFWAALLSVGSIGVCTATFYYQTLGDLPDVNQLKEVTLETPMKIYTADNKLIGEFGEAKRVPISFDKIPDKLKKAFLAIEDTRFYDHSGIDPIGIFRAALVSVTSASAKQGASTITQQVARNFFLTREKTIQRKLKEIFISLRIEQILTKEEIFELYLNKIALGHRSYGVVAAAQTYYGKTLDELTLGEMATIAGLPKAPSILNPISHPERSKERRHLVLDRMLSLGYITKEEFKKADNEPYKAEFHSSKLESYAPYVAESVRQSIIEKYGDRAYTDGFEIYTTVLSKDQEAAHYAVFKGVTDYDRRHGYRGASDNITDKENDKTKSFDLDKYLYAADKFHYIKPAIVREVNDAEKLLKAIGRNQEKIVITFDNLKWAAPFVSDRRQGPSPKKVSDVAHVGDLIYYYINDKKEAELMQIPEVEASIVALNQYNGAILALVGGYDFAKSKFDRVTQSVRQTGSNFKPFLYSAAVARGININSVFQDLPIKTWDPGSQTWWIPKNSPNRYDGAMTLREGLARSKNVVSIRLIRQIGVHNAVEHISKFGFNIPKSQQVEAMALGSVEVTPLDLVRGYAVFANGGFKVEPYLITTIKQNGNVIFEQKPKIADPKAEDLVVNGVTLEYLEGAKPAENAATQVLSHKNAFIIGDIMRSVIYGGSGISGSYWGTGGRAKKITGREDLHGKTGTTNNVHDAWFSGFNNHIVATAWMGFDSDRDLGYSRTQGPEGGAYSALPIWAEFIKISQDGKPQDPSPIPEDLTKCSNGMATDWCIRGGNTIMEGDDDSVSSYPNDPVQQKNQTEIDTSKVDSENIF